MLLTLPKGLVGNRGYMFKPDQMVQPKPIRHLVDFFLIFVCVILILIGLLMVASSSIVIAEKQFQAPFHYLYRHIIFLVLSFVSLIVILKIDMVFWKKLSPYIIIVCLIALVLVLMPGIGHTVNGSTRWIGRGFYRIQVSEFVKLLSIFYLAGYLFRHPSVQDSLLDFFKPLLILALLAGLLLAEPDFGATVVITLTYLGMLYVAGVKTWRFVLIGLAAAFCLLFLAYSSPYRLARMTTFINPWGDPFDSGYQLTQSLIAFGRGGWLGLGLGESIQKLLYLPEAHTDFILAVLAEEFGLLGVLTVMVLFTIFVVKAFGIAQRAGQCQDWFSAYLSHGIALWIGVQAMVNMGVNMGCLPTKGLTLPWISYGGNSVLVSCIAMAILLRIDYETRRKLLYGTHAG